METVVRDGMDTVPVRERFLFRGERTSPVEHEAEEKELKAEQAEPIETSERADRERWVSASVGSLTYASATHSTK